MKTKGIIFDKDGTLIDFDSFWTEIAYGAVNRIVQKTGSSAPEKEVLHAIGVSGGITDVDGVLCKGTYGEISQVIYGVLVKYGCKLTLEEITQISVEAFHENADKGVVKEPCKDLRGVLNAIKEKGVKIAVVTADDSFVTDKCLKALKIDGLFDVIYTDDGTHPNKPDPFCINDFCKKFGLKKEETVMVGDSLTDVEFAKNGGIKSIGVAKGEKNKAFLTGKADVVLPDVSYVLGEIE